MYDTLFVRNVEIPNHYSKDQSYIIAINDGSEIFTVC